MKFLKTVVIACCNLHYGVIETGFDISPFSNMDEDLQLAMVLSSSMTDRQTADNVHIAGSSHVAVRDGKKRKNK